MSPRKPAERIELERQARDDHIAELVDRAPRMTPAQAARIRQILVSGGFFAPLEPEPSASRHVEHYKPAEMTEVERQATDRHIAELVARAPRMTDEQADRLRRLVRYAPADDEDDEPKPLPDREAPMTTTAEDATLTLIAAAEKAADWYRYASAGVETEEYKQVMSRLALAVAVYRTTL